MRNILLRFLRFWNRKDTKAIARERLEFLVKRDRDWRVDEKAKAIKGKLGPLFENDTDEVTYEIKVSDQKAEMVLHIPLFSHSEIKEEKYEYCVNCE